MKFNKGMMAASTFAHHLNLMTNTTQVTVGFFTGPTEPTPAEEAAVLASMIPSTGLMAHSAVRTNLLTTRTELGTLFLPAFTQKKIGAVNDEHVWMFTQRTEEMVGTTAGTPTMALVCLHGGAAAYTAGNICRTIFFCSVGLPGSNADFIIDGDIVVGQRYRINDFKFKMTNLLGEI